MQNTPIVTVRKMQSRSPLNAAPAKRVLQTNQDIIVFPSPGFQLGIITLNLNQVALFCQKQARAGSQVAEDISTAELMLNPGAIPKANFLTALLVNPTVKLSAASRCCARRTPPALTHIPTRWLQTSHRLDAFVSRKRASIRMTSASSVKQRRIYYAEADVQGQGFIEPWSGNIQLANAGTSDA